MATVMGPKDQEFREKLRKYCSRARDESGIIAGFVMIRPDRAHDEARHRYQSPEERHAGREARRKWFVYLRHMGYLGTADMWRRALNRGISIMAVCPDPAAFDLGYIPTDDLDLDIDIDIDAIEPGRPADPTAIARIAREVRAVLYPLGVERAVSPRSIVDDGLEARRDKFRSTVRRHNEAPATISDELRERIGRRRDGGLYRDIDD